MLPSNIEKGKPRSRLPADDAPWVRYCSCFRPKALLYIESPNDDWTAWYRDVFGDDYYIELQNNHLEIQRAVLEGAVQVAQRLNIPMVATSDVHYIHREDAEAQDILLCVNTGRFRTDTNRMRMDSNEFFLRSPDEMQAAFPDMDDALRRTQEIADSVDIELELGKRHFPVFTPPEGKTSEELLREMCLVGLKDRYATRPIAVPTASFPTR